MEELFNKALVDLTWDDINLLVDCGCSENQYLEFKEKPSDGKDSWTHPQVVSQLAAEIVAFANSDGGVLVLGIKDEKNRAKEIIAVPECSSVADRLHRSFATIIDPYPVGLEVTAVTCNEDGKGVIVARVPASPEAPHGVRDKHRYHVTVRRGEESKTLGMRDIQIHTLETRRRGDEADQRLNARQAAFQSLDFVNDESSISAGYRITVTPARAVYRVPDLMANSTAQLLPDHLRWNVRFENGSPIPADTVFHMAFEGERRPCLRGMTEVDPFVWTA